MDKLDELQELDLLTAEEAFEAFGDKSSEVFESMRRDTKKTTTEVNQLFVQLGTDVSRDLEDFFFSKWDEGVEGMESVFIGAIRRMVSKLLTSQLLNFFGGFGDTFGALFSGGKASGSLGPAAALGGFRRGSPFIAGENGPELISPGAGSTVTPIGATFSFETNINGGSDLNAATLIPILEDNNRKLKSEFLTDLRDGAFA